MKAAFVVMSILGCDDSGIQCHPVAAVAQEWQTIATCDAASEKQLLKYKNVNYPTVVAVCQTAGTSTLADSEMEAEEDAVVAGDKPTVPAPPQVSKEDTHGLTARALALVRLAIPSTSGLKSTLVIPVHFVTGSYSWVVRKVVD
jgi:hypothetical protein